MPVVLSDEEYEALKSGTHRTTRDESPADRLSRELTEIRDGDTNAFREVIERYNKAVSPEEEDTEEPDEPFEYTEEFYADLEAVPDDDPNGIREVLAKHHRLPKTEG